MRNTTIGSLILTILLGGAVGAGCANGNPSYSTDGRTDGDSDLGSGAGDLGSGDSDLGSGAGDLGSATPDLAGAVACQLVPQSGCLPTQKCTTHDAVTTVCDPNGTANRGERCMTTSGVDSCYAGNACALAGPGIGICRSFCRANTDCGTRSYCELPLGTSGIRMCTQPCNALGAGCATGLGCTAYNFEHTDCRVRGTTAEGQPCAVPENCQPGMACLGPPGAERCRVLCQRGLSGSCPSPKVCTDIRYMDGTTWPTYGACF